MPNRIAMLLWLCCAASPWARGLAQAEPARQPGPATGDRAVAPARLQPFLQQRLLGAAADQRLPVYFVLADRLGPEHWFPRVLPLPPAERRRTVIAELRAHAEGTQAPLRELLAAEVAAGNAANVRSNWLGGFVQVEATAAVILRAAALPGIDSAWSDDAPPLAAVADGTAAAPCRTAPVLAGDGPIQTRAALVWTYGIRGQGVVIANVDGGLTAHMDLDGRRWTNSGEVAGNGLDDDQNGFVDDVHGWAFDLNSPAFDDGGGHGTQTAGLLVADGSCSGIAHGQAPAAELMTCRVLSESSQWNAVQYALQMGADVQTSSFSYKATFVPPPNYRMHRDVATASLAAGLIRLNSTGNDGGLCGDPTSAARLPLNVAAPGCVPAPYRDPNQAAGGLSGVIGVGAWRFLVDALDPVSPCGPFAWNLPDVQVNVPAYPLAFWDRAHHDDYPWLQGTRQGLLKPDVVGPTGNLTTTAGPCRTVTFAGTSNATACVAGALALWKSANPGLTPEDAAMILHQTAIDRGVVPGKENGWGAGVIDAERGLYRALCVHRVDFQSAWQVEHSLQAGAIDIAVHGAPSSLAAVVVGYQRAPGFVGPLLLGVGSTVGIVFAGVTDGGGRLSAAVPVGNNVAGQQFATQAVLWDQTITQRILDSNVVGITFVP